MNKEILLQEQMHLDEVKKKIKIELDKEQAALENQKEELLKERKKMWEEGSHGVADFDDIIDMAIYDEQVRQEHGHYIRHDETVRQLNYLLSIPYFGRIDFKEKDESLSEEIYIGRYGFCDKRAYKYEIYDWRTPIASMFYDCQVGDASYKCPAGEIEGELICKRQYRIEAGELKYCYDTNTAVQDEILGEVLAENTDKVLRVIIDTITKDQNQAIRKPSRTDLLVMGPAGSGKTSVGMHRLAYLLYHNREYLSSEKIVVMSRNEIFSSYVSGILPELGEENVRDVLFDRLLNQGIPKSIKKKWYYEQVEYLLAHKEDSVRKRSIRLKYSMNFCKFVKEELKRTEIVATVKKPDGATVIGLFLDLLKEYTKKDAKEVYDYTEWCINQDKLFYEDFLLIGYIRVIMGAIRPMDNISHVVIDEAQDYNPLQLMILKSLYPKSRFTILADPNQAIYKDISTTEKETFSEIFGQKLQNVELKKSYRSTAPINRYALDVIGIFNPSLYIDRPGKEPEVIIVNDAKKELQELCARISSEKSIGIVTVDKESAMDVKNALGKKTVEGRKVQYILRPDSTLEEKIVVLPIMLAKGLEFDVVIVWDDREESFWQENKNIKYLMCTRALHELYLLKKEV